MSKPKRQAAEPPSQQAPRVEWQTVVIPKLVRCESRSFLTKGQYLHVSDFVCQLVGFGSRRYDPTLRIAPIEEFWELKEKGSVLGRINLRLYFAYLSDRNEVVILHAYKKEDDGATPKYVLIRVRNRLRMYLSGELSDDATRLEYNGDDSWCP